MEPEEKRFFVSYSHDDQKLVVPVVALLRSTPTDVFLDVDTIEPGDDWWKRVQDALDSTSSFVIFWCSHASDSTVVKQEWEFALDKGKRIIPVLLDSTPLPTRLAVFQWIDFRSFATSLHPNHSVAVLLWMYLVRFSRFLSGIALVLLVLALGLYFVAPTPQQIDINYAGDPGRTGKWGKGSTTLSYQELVLGDDNTLKHLLEKIYAWVGYAFEALPGTGARIAAIVVAIILAACAAPLFFSRSDDLSPDDSDTFSPDPSQEAEMAALIRTRLHEEDT